MMFRILFICFICFSISCKKETEEFISESVFYYQPLRVGGTYFYRLDSFVTKPNSSVFEKHSYSLKDSIESVFSDNAGKMNYRVYRYFRDTLNVQEWKFMNAYTWTVNDDKLEMTENNLRFIKLASPLNTSTTWLGNAYIDTKSPNSTFNFLNNWQYRYEDIGTSFSVRKGLIANTITVHQADETDPKEPFSPSLDFHDRNYSVEVYAKGIGLIYKEYMHWTWQKNPNPGFQPNSYGITLNLTAYQLPK
jgi:hypothetical protein